MNLINDDILNKIKTAFDNEIYLVGGAVRDFYAEQSAPGTDILPQTKSSHDKDLVVMQTEAKVFAQETARLFKGTFVPLDEVNKIYR
ncbi:MAG: hypothetical protein LBK53_00365, partial [Heliobacteriaceae bacterium]|nr:hypothetical protein [Heliobacteriaceae bacterium]